MGLNPHWNRFNVAPVNGIIIIGHRRAMHSGLTRDNAINLIAWLTIATEATPEELSRELAQAETPTPGPSSPALNRHDGALKVVDKKHGSVIEIPVEKKIDGIKVVDPNGVKLKWNVPLIGNTGGE